MQLPNKTALGKENNAGFYKKLEIRLETAGFFLESS